jgi:hypothetical protein
VGTNNVSRYLSFLLPILKNRGAKKHSHVSVINSMQSLTCAIFASYPVVRKETTAGSHDFRGSFGRRPLGALVGLYESLQDLGDLALEGKTVGRDDLGAQALQADIPEEKKVFVTVVAKLPLLQNEIMLSKIKVNKNVSICLFRSRQEKVKSNFKVEQFLIFVFV